jgi:hypothetical protein
MGKSSLIIVLGFMVGFGLIQRHLFQKSLDAADNYIEDYERVAARNTTNSAIGIALRELTTDNNWAGCTDESLFDGTYGVVIQDSTVDSSLSSDQLQLISTSQVGEVSDTVRVIVEAESQVPIPSGAMGVNAASITFDFSGGSFSVDGTDTNPDGTAGPGPDMPGLTVSNSSDSAGAVAALPDSSLIDGAGGAPSVDVSADTTDLSYLGGWYRSRADLDLPGGLYDGVTWGTLGSPYIVYIEGDATLTGTSTGAGILVVEGSLEFKGECEWYGVVLVFGTTLTLSAAVGTPCIYGALLMQADTATLDLRGNMSLVYSSSAIESVRQNLNKSKLYQVVSWWE